MDQEIAAALCARLSSLQRQDRAGCRVRPAAGAARIRAQVPDGHLWVDANGGYDLATALAVAPQLADAGVDVLEAPLRPNCISGYQALKQQGAVPITLDEGVVSPVEAEEFMRLRMVDGLTIKVSRCGGLSAARRQIELVARRRPLLAR